MRLGRGAALLATVTATLCLLAPPAGARIVLQTGIARINLGLTRAQVVARKGQPDGERTLASEFFGRVRIMRYGQTKAFFSGTKRSAEVNAVRTKDREQRTASGVGVGSTEAAVRERIAGVRCGTDLGTRHCFVGYSQPGRRITEFFISRRTRRVTEVVIGFVVD